MERPTFTSRPGAGDKAIVISNDTMVPQLALGAAVMVIWDPFLEDGTLSVDSLHVPVLLLDQAQRLDVNPKDDLDRMKLLTLFNQSGAYVRWGNNGGALPPEIMPLLE